jgi:hypothetical protein
MHNEYQIIVDEYLMNKYPNHLKNSKEFCEIIHVLTYEKVMEKIFVEE